MPYRKYPLVTNEIYHVFNRGVACQPILNSKSDYKRFFDVIKYYKYQKQQIRFSYFNNLSLNDQNKYLQEFETEKNKQVEILSCCLIPNHFHFLLKEIINNGILNFIKTFQNSYAKYFNIKNKRNGPLFQNRFRAILIENDEQFLHVSRYIHLNPYSSRLINNINDLENYCWSSFPDYMGLTSTKIFDKELLMSFFKTYEELRNFTFDQADYQRKLADIKHLIID